MKKEKCISVLMFLGIIISWPSSGYGFSSKWRSTSNSSGDNSKKPNRSLKISKSSQRQGANQSQLVTQRNERTSKDRLIRLVKQELANKNIRFDESFLDKKIDDGVLNTFASYKDEERVVVESIVEDIEKEVKREQANPDKLRSKIEEELTRLGVNIGEYDLSCYVEGVQSLMQEGKKEDDCIKELVRLLKSSDESNFFQNDLVDNSFVNTEENDSITVSAQYESLTLQGQVKLVRENVRSDGNCLIYSLLKGILDSLKASQENDKLREMKMNWKYSELIKFVERDDLSKGATVDPNSENYNYTTVLNDASMVRKELSKKVADLLKCSDISDDQRFVLSEIANDVGEEKTKTESLSYAAIPLLLKIFGFEGRVILIIDGYNNPTIFQKFENGDYPLKGDVCIYFKDNHYQAYVHNNMKTVRK